ncbi:MAG: chorismate-binding protein [Flavobacteriaceae bacterium]
MRTAYHYRIKDKSAFKRRLLLWAQRYNEVVWLDSNDHKDIYGSKDGILAVGAASSIQYQAKGAFLKLKEFIDQTEDWIFGYLSYDLKNDLEDLSSNGYDGLGFPDLYFFQPKKIIRIKDQMAEFLYLSSCQEEVLDDIEKINSNDKEAVPATHDPIKIRMRMFKETYYHKVGQMLKHIQRGNIYEANFCQEFYAQQTIIDPVTAYRRLNKISRPPFAAYLKIGPLYLISASPERFLKKQGDLLVSQPIKGTARRSSDSAEDEQLKKDLGSDPKERAENIMIVDLVRNDLSKFALKGSVKVKELCKVYSFEQVHQMISTIEATVAKNTHPADLLKATFPMGSMTGAPKYSAMKIIEELERTKRGLYSGAVGYFEPDKNFDFNVVIRSILYNHKRQYLSFSVGSAITAKALPEKEYQECLLKAKAMRLVLEKDDVK